MRFALNHITAPAMPVAEFFAMATRLGIREVEIRNDLPDVVGRSRRATCMPWPRIAASPSSRSTRSTRSTSGRPNWASAPRAWPIMPPKRGSALW
ncbi:hypothetical protein QWZ10_16980 [Paracoccus cavernae]|uniref:Xylose isomerase-like TIM barrel domain-containing protein n=1 Tax=Paracoccus cavernae TaxID=1571207 RepID=A0ABT8DC43_9RHOB|nr:hypothetical protein [Paracoccus cavernae]